MLRRHCLTLPLLASHEGRHGLLAQLAILQADEALKHDAGKEYEAEVVLFVVSPAARGMGVGRRLFNHMLGVFHDAGLREYFLFTDSTCDVGFYDHRGLIRKAERDDWNDGSSRPNPTDSSSSGLTVGTTSLLADDEPMSYFLYEGRC
jgi:N-acetylglutamate synthase and related acetyltransferases